eukprot:2099731-Rhodomonas_salina.1
MEADLQSETFSCPQEALTLALSVAAGFGERRALLPQAYLKVCSSSASQVVFQQLHNGGE